VAASLGVDLGISYRLLSTKRRRQLILVALLCRILKLKRGATRGILQGNLAMLIEPSRPSILTGTESTAKIIRSWLIDEKKTRSGLIGVNDALQIVAVRTFQHPLTLPALSFSLEEPVRGSATGIVAYGVVDESRPSFDTDLIGRFAQTCEALNMTLLDVIIYSSGLPKGWLSARQQNLL
jgi:hypothetical protein